jgi:hypothetical protein
MGGGGGGGDGGRIKKPLNFILLKFGGFQLCFDKVKRSFILLF